jgi:hypothetical protein
MTMINPIAQLGVLFTQADERDRVTARQIEDAADQAAAQDAENRVAQLQAKADADRSQSLVTGSFTIAGGLCTAGGAFFARDCPRDIAVRQGLNGSAESMRGLGEMLGGLYRGDADRADADAARFEAQTQADGRRFDRAQGDERAANESIQKVEQFVDQIQQTENATRLATTTYRG